jgi:hypothetical protein
MTQKWPLVSHFLSAKDGSGQPRKRIGGVANASNGMRGATSRENAWTDSPLPVAMLYAMFGSGGMNVLDEPAIFAPI